MHFTTGVHITPEFPNFSNVEFFVSISQKKMNKNVCIQIYIFKV